MEIEEIYKCRICGNPNLIPILNLGLQALSGRFPKNNEPDPPKAQLELVKCDSKNSNACGLLQLKHKVPGDELYLHDYGYRSGLNTTMTNHLKELVKEIEQRINLTNNDIILDIGSNDATLLKSYSIPNIKKIGIDPTGKQFQKYYTREIKLIPDFFNEANFRKIFPNENAKVITSIAMFYDLQDPMQFIQDIKNCLDKDGIWIFEQSYMPSMLETKSFDTICHEHLEYYALKQIKWMMDKNNLKIIDVSFNDINGGSFRITVCHKDASYQENKEKINEILKNEEQLGLDALKPYQEFKEKVEDIKQELVSFLKQEKANGKTIYIYGASTKGNTLLQYFNIDSSIIAAAAERNPEKFGRVTPLTRIPIISEEEARKANPDYFIVLPWHFKKEFLIREKSYLDSGGKFIFPLPKFEIHSGGNTMVEDLSEEEFKKRREFITGIEKDKEQIKNLQQDKTKKKALITGITGQMGSYLAELLIEKGYEVYGVIRRTSSLSARQRLEHLRDKIDLIYGDLTDYHSLDHIIRKVQPDEIYNLAAQSHVWVSFLIPEYTSNVGALGVLRVCESAKKLDKPVKIFQASTSELYGGIYDHPVNEETNFYPRSPYGVAKLYGYWIMRNYREAYNMFCSNGIIFNTESPRRGENFVTRKITLGIAEIMKGNLKKLSLGNLNARRDWSHAKDVVQAIWKILQQDKPNDYVIASGETHSIREFVEEAFRYAGIEIAWKGQGLKEVGYDKKTNKVYIDIDPLYFRPSEVEMLIGDSGKARKELEWKPTYNFKTIVQEMMEHDLK